MAKRSTEPKGRVAAKTTTRKQYAKPSGKTTQTSRSPSPVTGRFVTPAGKPRARKPAVPAQAPAGPAGRTAKKSAPGKPSARATPVAKGTAPDGASTTTSDVLVDHRQAFAVEVLTGSGKSEVFELDEELRRYRDALIAQLGDVVLPGILARIIKGAVSIAPADLARRMLSVAPAPAPANRMAEQIGPEYYDTNGVTVILAGPGSEPVSKQAVEQRRRRRTILALPTPEGRWIYPTWQFRDHAVVPGLAEVLLAFSPRELNGRSRPRVAPFSEWSVGTWLTTPREDLDDLTAIEWLEAGHDRGQLLELARRTATAWAA